MNADTPQTMTILVKALNGPLMLILVFVQMFMLVALCQVVIAINRIAHLYDEQVNGSAEEPSPSDLAP